MRLGDLGESLTYLYLNGLTLGKHIINDVRQICRTAQIELTNSELTAEVSSPTELGDKLHLLIQTALKVSDYGATLPPNDTKLVHRLIGRLVGFKKSEL